MRALVLALLLLPRAASAQKDVRSLYEVGRQAYEATNYALSVSAFEEAYKLDSRPTLAFSLAQAHRLQYAVDGDPAHLVRALALYRRYIDEVPSGGRREDAVNHSFALGVMIARLERDGAASERAAGLSKTVLAISSRTRGAVASVDGAPARPIPFSVEVPAGTHEVEASAPGHHPEVVEAIAVEGSFVVVPLELRPVPARLLLRGASGELIVDGKVVEGPELELPAGPHRVVVADNGHLPMVEDVTLEHGATQTLEVQLAPSPQRRASMFVLGGAGALAAGGLVAAGLAVERESAARALAQPLSGATALGQDAARAYNGALADRDGARTAAVVLLGGAAATGITGLLLFLLDRPYVDPQALRAPVLQPVITPDAVGAAIGGAL